MSGTATATPVPVGAAASTGSLARLEMLRLARHPLFVLAVLLFAAVTVTTPLSEYADADHTMSADGPETNLDWPVLPAFVLGLGGLIAMNRLTTSSDRAADVVGAAPVPETRRTAALCLACLLPAAVAAAGAGYVLWFWLTDPPVNSVAWRDFETNEKVAMMACGVLAALGGSLLGVLVARWWRWPTAAAVTALLLIVVCVPGGAPIRDDSLAMTVFHNAVPFSLAGSNSGEWMWMFGIHWWWRVVYVAGLCVLAALGAIAHGTSGAERRRMRRLVLVVAVVVVAALLLASFTGRDGGYGYWDPAWSVGG